MTGSVTPRIWTPPLRDLNDRAASYGWEVIDFAERIGWPLDPWQRWVAVRLGELLPSGLPRFRRFLILVARQNGKTLLMRVLILYWLYVDAVDLVLGTHLDREKARKSWLAVVKMAERNPRLAAGLARQHHRITVGQESFWTTWDSTYVFAAPNSGAGRGDTVDRVLWDELREYKDWEAYNAAMNALRTIPDGQAIAITNQGSDEAVVLDALREAAMAYIETGVGDYRLGIAEWSAPNGSAVDDPQALAAANPNLGRRIELDALIGEAQTALQKGGEMLAGFKTEALCMRVHSLNPAITEEWWEACGTDDPIDLAPHRKILALCLDVALDGSHAALVAAATIDGITHVELVETWIGFGCTQALRRDLPGIVHRLRPRRVGWFPSGPAAAVAATVKAPSGSRTWWPRRTEVQEISGLGAEAAAVCMGFADVVAGREVRHPRDAALTAHVTSTEWLTRGDAQVFTRQGARPINAAYAAAGAVHLARTMPPPPPPLTAV